LAFVVAKTREYLQRYPDALIVVGSYTIGKEKVFTAIAEETSGKVFVDSKKRKVSDRSLAVGFSVIACEEHLIPRQLCRCRLFMGDNEANLS